MNDKNYINFHILISHSPSNLNRDDMNMQKTATFGGTRRVRVSSQSLKRAMRTSAYYADYLGQSSDRTRQLGSLAEKYIKELNEKFPKDLITDVIKKITGITESWTSSKINSALTESFSEEQVTEIFKYLDVTKADSKTKITLKNINEQLGKKLPEDQVASVVKRVSLIAIKADEQLGAVAAWSLAEVEKYCQLYQQLQEQNPDLKAFEKAWNNAVDKKKLIDNKTQLMLFRAALQNSQDIALSGRMATSGIMTNVDAALAVAHAITTHTVDGDIDWFTAVDDLNQETGETGSAHLDTTEFSAGVFYRYASLNIRQLQENLGAVDRQQALDIAAHVLHMLATIVPTAKQNAFAAFNLADFAFVAFSDQPISLANAFENPVKLKGQGFLTPSIEAFVSYHQVIYQAFGLNNDPQACFSTKNCSMELDNCMGSDFIKLKEWIKHNGA